MKIFQQLYYTLNYFLKSMQNESLRKQGEFVKAKDLAAQTASLALQNLGNDHYIYGIAVRDLGLCNLALGDFHAAIKNYTESTRILQTHEVDYSKALSELGSSYLGIGDLENAEVTLRKAVELKRKFNPHSRTYGVSLSELAATLVSAGKIKEAFPLIWESLDILERYPNTDDYFASALNVLGEAYRAIGSYSDAGKYLFDAFQLRQEILGVERIEVAQSLMGVGMFIFEVQGDIYIAERYLLRARDIYRNCSGTSSTLYYICLMNLAIIYESLGNYDRATSILNETITELGNNVGKSNYYRLVALNNLASSYNEIGEQYLAESRYTEAIALGQKSLRNTHPLLHKLKSNISYVYEATDRETNALLMLHELNLELDRQLAEIFSITSEAQMLSFVDSCNAYFYQYLAIVVKYFSDNSNSVNDIFDFVQRRKGLVADGIGQRRRSWLQELSIYSELQEFNRLNQMIVQSSLRGPSNETVDNHESALKALINQRDNLETVIATSLPYPNYVFQIQKIKGNDIQLSLSENFPFSALVEYLMVDIEELQSTGYSENSGKPSSIRHYVAFISFADTTISTTLIDLGSAEIIDREITAFRSAVINDDTAEYEYGCKLRSSIFDPIVQKLQGYQRLFIAPDGQLLNVPFDALPIDDNQRVIDNYRISYLTVGREMLGFRKVYNTQDKASLETSILIGDPDFNLAYEEKSSHQNNFYRSESSVQTNHKFIPLPATAQEVIEVGKLLNVTPWIGKDATKSKILNADSPYILHIASHGFFLENQKYKLTSKVLRPFLPISENGAENIGFQRVQSLINPMLRSGLALAGANNIVNSDNLFFGVEEGLLTAEDIIGLNLVSTEMVVLSACETGLGEIQRSEGVFGLRRSFFAAGAQTLIISLWKVPEDATKKLMIEFYERLLQGESRSDALRNAQLNLRKNRYNNNTLAWAGFICQGNPGKLHINNAN